MPDPIAPVENSQPSNVGPNIDAELDAALGKSFGGSSNSNDVQPVSDNTNPIKNDVKENKPEPEQQKEEVKASSQKKTDKPNEVEKPTLTPEEIDKIDPKDKGAWGAIKNANKRAHAIISEKESEISKLKATLAEKTSVSQKELDAIKAEKSELEKYRAMVDIQADPEFVSKYDQPIEKSINGIKEMIASLGVTKETVDGIDFKDPARLEKVIDLISQNRDRFTASKIERKIKEYLELNDKRDETLQEHKNNYKETLEKRKQESFAKQSEGEGRMIKHLELKASEKDKDGKALIPFLNKLDQKENATPAELDQINNHNSMVDVMGKKLQEVMKMKEPEQQAEIAIAAVASHYLMAQLRLANDQLKKAQEQLNKMAAVTTESPSRKPNNPMGRNGNSEPLDTDAALASFGFKGRR